MQLRRTLKSAFTGLNRLFGMAGFRIVPASTPPRSAADFYHHLAQLGFSPSLVVDVGVADGTPEIYAAFPDSRYLLVEPLLEFEPRLRELCSELDAEYILAAAGSENGFMSFHVHDDLLGSSLLGEVEGAAADGEPRQVHVVRLDRVIPKNLAAGSILVKADVQGTELQVLEGLEDRLDKIGVVVLETALISSMIGGPEFSDIVSHMKVRGFVIYDIIGGYYRPLDGALKQVDLAFVPERSDLRQDRRFASAEGRKRLNRRGRRRWQRQEPLCDRSGPRLVRAQGVLH